MADMCSVICSNASIAENIWSGWILIKEAFVTTELYLQKAEILLAKGLEEKALESLLAALDFQDDDIISKTQVRCFLGEYFFVHQRYTQAYEQFEWIVGRAEWLEQEYDDLINEEIKKADVLLGIMQKFGLRDEQ